MLQMKELCEMNEKPRHIKYGTALIIDGDVNSQKQLREYLTEHFNIFTAHDGHLGIEMAVDHRPDVIILDFHTPFLDGLSTLMLLKDFPETKYIPVMMIGADVKKTNIVAAIKSGASDIMLKPIRNDAILKKTIALIEKSQER